MTVRFLFLACFLAGILLGTRLMFFGAEKRRDGLGEASFRRWEPAAVSFPAMFGLVGYLLLEQSDLPLTTVLCLAAAASLVWAVIATKLAVAAARAIPDHDMEDPRFTYQGRVGVVTETIAAGAGGTIRLDDGPAAIVMPARAMDAASIDIGEEVCIERLDHGVALVERWALVEQRL